MTRKRTVTKSVMAAATAKQCHSTMLTKAIYATGWHIFLVQKMFYEGGDALMFDDRTGRETGVPTIPRHSLSDREFIMLGNGAGGVSITVWRVVVDTAIQEWS